MSANRRSTRMLASLVLLAASAGCSSLERDTDRPTTGQTAVPDGASTSGATGGPELHDPRPCTELAGFTCSTLTVPLDHGGGVGGALELAVAVADNADAPRGVLLFLAGGPGQPGVSTVPRVMERYLDPAALEQYRLVMFDQRGTGQGAIECAELQAAVGGSDFLTPPADAVEACGEQLSDKRDFLSTPDTVQDIELLRRALGAETMAIDGVSYGTFTAEHYALAHPERVGSLVLDSVVPQEGFEPFALAEMSATRQVLNDVCAASSCGSDPVDDLAWLVRDGDIDGPALIETLAVTSLSSVDPSFAGVPEALADARAGDTDALEGLLETASSAGLPADQLSAGLHLATLCADMRFPWGDSSTPIDRRQAALERALADLRPDDVAPYDVATAESMLAVQGCRYWPESRPAMYSQRARIEPPTLIVAGERDLFTPLEWARRQLRQTVDGELVVVSDGGHGAQASDDPIAREAVTGFLLQQR